MDMDNVGWQMIEGCWEPIEHEDRVPAGGACPVCNEGRLDELVWVEPDSELVRCNGCGAVYDPLGRTWFWLCYTSHDSGRTASSWIIEGSQSPDNRQWVVGCCCDGTPADHLHRTYPFNGMGGRVYGGYLTREEAESAMEELA